MQKKITDYYKIENEQIEVSSFDLLENLEKIVKILEEPIGNQTSVLNFILSNRVKEKVLFTEMVVMKFFQDIINIGLF